MTKGYKATHGRLKGYKGPVGMPDRTLISRRVVGQIFKLMLDYMPDIAVEMTEWESDHLQTDIGKVVTEGLVDAQDAITTEKRDRHLHGRDQATSE